MLHHCSPCDVQYTKELLFWDLGDNKITWIPRTTTVKKLDDQHQYRSLEPQKQEMFGVSNTYSILGGGFKLFLFSTLLGEIIQFDYNIFQTGWNHQLE